MSEDSNKEKQQVEVLTDDCYNSDEDPFSQFLTEDLEQCTFFTDSFCEQLLPRTTQILLEYNSGKWVPRLREPRDLYGLSPAGHVHLVRWPHQYEVIRDRIKHIEWVPPHPEPLYTPTGLEAEPLCPEPSEGAVVYLADEVADKDSSFMCSRIGGSCPSKQVLPQSWDDWDNTLIFEGRFESGNLQKVVKISDFEYQLTLRTDLYTKKHTQWYYFQVTNTQAGIPYRFTIVNFTKPTSLYNRGMRPLLYSEAEAKIHKVGWQRTGDEIKYYRNNLSQDGRQYFSLTWTFQFPHNRDTCYFAHCYPYTYSNLQDYLSAIATDPKRSKFCKVRILCHTLARNIVYVLTITNPLQDFKEEKRKAAVILTARVHPGETNSSWTMKGFLDYILGDSMSAQLLRDTYVFKVVPMLNPDGVIVGNYRCSLAGRDLNRNYKSELKDSFPSIWYTRTMIKRILEERSVLLYCDLHGHSRKENVFMYGCEKREQQEEGTNLHQRIFPLIMSKNCPDKFSFSDCNFKIQKSKEGTGRVVMWKMGISNSYTLEVTFCGSKLGSRHGTHFSTKDLESIGYHFCDSLLDFCNENQKGKYNEYLKELEEMAKQDDAVISVTETADRDSSSDSSDSNEFAVKQDTQAKPKKKCLKTKRERGFSLESPGRRISKHSQEPVSEDKKSVDTSPRISKSQEQIIKNTQIFQKLKLMELQNMQREKCEISKQNRESFSRTPNTQKGCPSHFWECVKEESQNLRKMPDKGYVFVNSFFHSTLKGSRRSCEPKNIARFHELLKESSSIIKDKPHQTPFLTQTDSMPDEPAKYTVQYLSHYFPEQGLNIGWDLAQPLKQIISQRLFLPPTALNQACSTNKRNGALSGCRLPRVENMGKEAKSQQRTSLVHMERNPSSVFLSQATGETQPEKGFITLELGEKELQNIALAQEAHFSSPYNKATTWRLEKHQHGRAASCREKTSSQMKGLFESTKFHLDGKERIGKEWSPSRNTKPDRSRGGCREAGLRLTAPSQTQDFLQLSLPLVSEGKYGASTEKYYRDERHPRSLGEHRLHLATLSTTKGTNKTIVLKDGEEGEASGSTSLLQTRSKIPRKTSLCQIDSKFFSKRHKSQCLSLRSSMQDLSTTIERLSFPA